LGLGNLRYLATEDHIRVARRFLVRLLNPISLCLTRFYFADRRKVLRHHPDKKAGTSTGGSNDDSFFKCIAKAFEVLTNPETRKQFDSIDPTIEDYVPNPKDVKAEEFGRSSNEVNREDRDDANERNPR
jgi:DnaJ family protein C protein 2